MLITMNALDEFYKKIQTYLMKQNHECGELKFISSRITLENNNDIDNLCKSIIEIFENFHIPIKEKASINDDMCVSSYKYLLLNTNFTCQDRLAEDIINGYLVDMCPPLSPYLLIQILWNLEYEKILIQSLFYLPFDLCIEVWEIMKKCIQELPFQRSLESIYQLILILYFKCFQLKETGMQSTNHEETLKKFLICFEELLLLLTDPNVTHLTELSDVQRYERYGIIFKRLIRTIKTCLEYKVEIIPASKDIKKQYTVTFGRESFIKCEDIFNDTMMELQNKLINSLLLEIQKIDCNIYCEWVELNDSENNMLSLQRSIGIECYYFLEVIKNDEYLMNNTQLINFLQQLSSSDTAQSKHVLSIQELCYAIHDDTNDKDAKKDLMLELLSRYKEWDLCHPQKSTFGTVLQFVYENRSLVYLRNYLYILEYLHFVLTHSSDDNFKEFIYNFVIKVLSQQSLTNTYDIVVMYIVKHDGKNYLETLQTEKMFNDFITKSTNFKKAENVKTVLLFLMKSPTKILTTLLKIVIGYPQYSNIMISADDLLLLSPIMQIRKNNNEVFLTSILKTVCLENIEWNLKKFMNLIKAVLDSSIIKVHDLINNIFIPYLEDNETLNISNLNSILYNIRKLQTEYAKDTSVPRLIVALAKRMSPLRRNTNISKHVMSEVFAHITRILEYSIEMGDDNLSASMKREIVNEIEHVIEPIDRLYFASLWHSSRDGVSIIDMVEDYEKRCFSTLNKLKENPKTTERLRNYLRDFTLLREDFLRHLIIQSTDTEYVRLASELTIVYWYSFGWNDEIEACNQFLRLTIQACCLSLEYPSIGGPDLFAFLLKCFMGFYAFFMELEGMMDNEKVYQSVIANINLLHESIKHTSYAPLFTVFLDHLNDVQQDSDHMSKDILNVFYDFIRQCFEFNFECDKDISSIPHSPKISNFYVTHELISACMKVPAIEAYECIKKLSDLF